MTKELIKKLDQLFADSIQEHSEIEGLAAFQMAIFTIQCFVYEGQVIELHKEMKDLLDKYFPARFLEPYEYQ